MAKKPTPPPAEGSAPTGYTARVPIQIGKDRYAVGETVEADPDAIAELLALGAVAKTENPDGDPSPS